MPELTHSSGHGMGTGNITLLLNPELCTLDTCDLSLSSFDYIPTLPGNAILAAIFGALLIGQLFLGIKHKTWGFMAAMVCGLVLEIIGYVGRIMLHNEPFINAHFLMYLVTLTIAPAFLSAAVYLCLSRIIIVYGTHLSYFKPGTYTIVFCSCDLVSLLLQAAGGGISSSANTADLVDIGKNIMLAGLGFQVFSLLLFAIASGDFACRVWKGRGTWNESTIQLVRSTLFKAFLLGLVTATLTIFARSVYRCAELSGGFNSELFTGHEAIFMVLEGVMIVLACAALTFLHPAVCFQGAWDSANFSFRNKNDPEINLKNVSNESVYPPGSR